jgi:hypothetical protein
MVVIKLLPITKPVIIALMVILCTKAAKPGTGFTTTLSTNPYAYSCMLVITADTDQ